MKRIISVSLCLLILFSLIGCSNNVVANVNQSSNKDLLITEKTTQHFSDDPVPYETSSPSFYSTTCDRDLL